MPVEAKKVLQSGNEVTLVFTVEPEACKLYASYAHPPSDADRAEVKKMVDELVRVEGIEEI